MFGLLDRFIFTLKIVKDNDYYKFYHVTLSDLQIFSQLFSRKIMLLFGEPHKPFFGRVYYRIHNSLIFDILSVYLIAYKTTKMFRFKKAITELINNTHLKKALSGESSVKVNYQHLVDQLVYKPYGYQKEFILKFADAVENRGMRGLYLAFEQGLGKTLTAISVSLLYPSDQKIIVCPNSLKIVWVTELLKLVKKYHKNREALMKDTYVENITGGDPKGKKFIITNFKSLNKTLNKLNKSSIKTVVVDESHYVKELTSSRTKLLMELVLNYNVKYLLLQSGTPIKGESRELLPIIRLIDPHLNEDSFNIIKKLAPMADKNKNMRELFRLKFHYLAHRKTKLDVADTLKLPPKKRIYLKVKLANIEKYEIDNVKEEMKKYIKDYLDREEPHLKEYRQIIDSLVSKYRTKNKFLETNYEKYNEAVKNIRNGDILPEDQHKLKQEYEKQLLTVMEPEDKRKFKEYIGRANNLYSSALGKAIGMVYMKMYRDMIIDLARTVPDIILKEIYETSISKKIIIVSQYPESLEVLNKLMIERGFKTKIIIGSTSMKERADIIADFKEKDDITFLFGTLSILAVGFTLTEADSLVFLDEPWRWVDEQQTEDRIHRIGQVNTARIFFFRIEHNKKTLADRKNEILERSKEIFDDIINNREKIPIPSKYLPELVKMIQHEGVRHA